MTTIVMTGGTSGFGEIAANRLAENDGVRLILGAREPTPDSDSIRLDLASLDSAREFATSVTERLDGELIDALVLNAGLIRPDVAGRTVDGVETTFAVNHLAHYLMLRRLLPVLAEEATVVLTTSGTHDPETGAGLTTPRHADAEMLAYPDRDPDQEPHPRKAGQHAYTASKLCAVLTVRWLAQQDDVRSRRISVIAYDPGQVFGTGLAKDLMLPMRVAWSVLGSPVGRPLRRFNRFLNTRAAAGNALADLASRRVLPPDGRTYSALRHDRLTWPDPSELARRDHVAQALWTDSARLVGLTDT